MKSRSFGIFLLGIVALSGLGLGGYMFVKYEVLSPITPTEESGFVLVGIWDDIDQNLDYAPWNTEANFLLEFSNSPMNDTNYISFSNNNTNFTLLKTGYYKITLTLLLQNLEAGAIYWVYLLRNGSLYNAFERIAISSNPSSPFYHVQSSLYIYGNGVDSFTMDCYCSGDSSFEPSSSNAFNQLSIEYVMQ